MAAKKVNEQKNFISLLHQQILNNLKDSKIDNLYPIGKGITFHIIELGPFSEIHGRQSGGPLIFDSSLVGLMESLMTSSFSRMI